MSVFDRFLLDTNQAIMDKVAKVMQDRGEVDIEKVKKKSETAETTQAEINQGNQVAPEQQ